MLVDTVGLIKRLPHHLVEAFKSTLEEASNADVILHICDASNDSCREQAEVTLKLLNELGCEDIPVVTVLNKCDLVPYIDEMDFSNQGDSVVKISAKNSEGLDRLLEAISSALPQSAKRMKILLPFDKGGLLSKIRIDGKVFSEEYTAEGILCDVLVDKKILPQIENYSL